jgi:hypothetical protein
MAPCIPDGPQLREGVRQRSVPSIPYVDRPRWYTTSTVKEPTGSGP